MYRNATAVTYIGRPENEDYDCSGPVYVLRKDGDFHTVDPRLDLENKSPTGLSWSYGGSGPAQLALAILAYETDDSFAMMYYQEFKWDVIAKLPKGKWKLDADEVRRWITERRDAA